MNKKSAFPFVAAPIQVDNPEILPDIKLVNEFLQFVSWKATPERLREIKTQKEFAHRIGVSQDTLSDWKKLAAFKGLLWQTIRERMQDDIPEIIDGLHGKIVSGKGGAGDVRLYLALSEGELEGSVSTKK